MEASQNLPGVLVDAAVGRDGGPTPGSVAEPESLVIENLAEFAAAGVSGYCQICWADYVASPVPA